MSTIILPEQFKDADIEREFESKTEYGRWFKAEKKKYLQTISFQKLLQSSDYRDIGREPNDITNLLTAAGDSIYVPNPGLNNYTIFDFRQDLELLLQPFTLLSLICYDVHLKLIDGRIYAVGTKRNSDIGVTLAASFDTRKIYYYTEENGLKFVASYDDKKKSMGSSYEYLFRELCLPISVVMNSVSTEDCPRHENLTTKTKNEELYKRYLASQKEPDFNESLKVNKHYMSNIFK